MQDKDSQIKQLQYHLDLLISYVDKSRSPLTYMIVKNKLSEEQVNRVLTLCQDLTFQLEKEKEEGLLYFFPLLERFRQNLPPGLDEAECMETFINENMFLPLMLEFQQLSSNKKFRSS